MVRKPPGNKDLCQHRKNSPTSFLHPNTSSLSFNINLTIVPTCLLFYTQTHHPYHLILTWLLFQPAFWALIKSQCKTVITVLYPADELTTNTEMRNRGEKRSTYSVSSPSRTTRCTNRTWSARESLWTNQTFWTRVSSVSLENQPLSVTCIMKNYTKITFLVSLSLTLCPRTPSLPGGPSDPAGPWRPDRKN